MKERGVLLGSAAVDAGRAWSCTVSLPNGTHELTATATDAAGNVSTPHEPPLQVVVDSKTPARPEITALVDITNADPVPVSGTADAGAVVRLYEGSVELETASVDAGGHWSASLRSMGEGEHRVRARETTASGRLSEYSDEKVVRVDRTPPTVVSQIPAPGAVNVWSRDLITVTFSEPIDRGTISTNTVAVTLGDGATPGYEPNLTNDTQLSISLRELPAVPNHVSIALGNGIRDLAGNPLVLPSAPWGWDLPVWATLPSIEVVPVLSATSSVNPLGAVRTIGFAMAGDDTAWAAVRDPSYLTLLRFARDGVTAPHGWGLNSALAVPAVMGGSPDETPVVAYLADAGGAVSLRASPATASIGGCGLFLWHGGQQDGPWNLDTTRCPVSAALAIDQNSRISVAWAELVGTTYTVRVQVGTGMKQAFPTSSTTPPALALAASDSGVSLVYADGASLQLARWKDAGGWTSFSQYPTIAAAQPSALSLTHDDAGVEVTVACVGGTGTVLRWQTGFSPRFVAVGSEYSGCRAPLIAYRPSGALGERLLVLDGDTFITWDGARWVSRAAPDNANGYAAVNTRGVVGVGKAVFLTPGSLRATIVTSRYNR